MTQMGTLPEAGLRIAVMQASGRVLDLGANLGLIERAAREASAAGAHCLVTPELFICGYAPSALEAHLGPQLVQQINAGAQKIARECALALVYSAPQRGPEGWHIAAKLIDDQGLELLEYLKVHLYGEEEHSVFLPGNQPPAVASLHGHPVGLLVCYDAEFPESVRRLAEAGAQAVLVPTALGAGYDEVPQVLLRARAVENQVMIAYANHTGSVPTSDGTELLLGGGSVLIGPSGQVLGQAPDTSRTGFEIIVADLTRRDLAHARARSTYLRDRRPSTYAAWDTIPGRATPKDIS